MEIAVNARFLLKNRIEGIGRFTFETFKIITQHHKQVKFHFLFDRPYANEFIFSDNIVPVALQPPARHPFLWYLWFEFSVKNYINRKNIDLFISPDGFIPLNQKVKTISVIHDLNFEHRPADIPVITRTFYQKYFPKYAAESNRIITVSEYSKNDISRTYKIKPNKIDVVYNGVSQIFKPLNQKSQHKVREIFSNSQLYFLYVGAIHHRKNIKNLLLAFEQFCFKTGTNYLLLLVGKSMFGNKELEQVHSNMKFKDRVVFTGRLSDEELHKVLASAVALTFVPYFEGFGIPAIEAMKSGVPVITSNVTSLPEVVEDAGLLVDPDSVDEICNAMVSITNDQQLRQRLIASGLEKSKSYTWEETASRVWQSITNCLNSNE